MTILLFLFAVVGLTDILMNGAVLDDHHTGLRARLRRALGRYGDVLDCPICTGFWSGIVCALLLFTTNPLTLLACGCAGAGMMKLHQQATTFLDSHTKV